MSNVRIIVSSLCMAFRLLFPIAESKPAVSPMWGVHGELFSPQGKLRDWSRAGYGAGDRPIPRPASFSDLVVDWDAAGDGITDDTEARCYPAVGCVCGCVCVCACVCLCVFVCVCVCVSVLLPPGSAYCQLPICAVAA